MEGGRGVNPDVPCSSMLACADVHYRDDGSASCALLLFDAWTSERASEERVVQVAEAAPYEPGAFYLRELPCLLAVLGTRRPDVVIVDGLVWTGPGVPGLGARLHEAVPGIATIVGVAKTHFHGAPATAVVRGRSTSPLWVDEIGVPVDAPARIREMHGAFRVPSLLRRVDQLCRTHAGDIDAPR